MGIDMGIDMDVCSCAKHEFFPARGVYSPIVTHAARPQTRNL